MYCSQCLVICWIFINCSFIGEGDLSLLCEDTELASWKVCSVGLSSETSPSSALIGGFEAGISLCLSCRELIWPCMSYNLLRICCKGSRMVVCGGRSLTVLGVVFHSQWRVFELFSFRSELTLLLSWLTVIFLWFYPSILTWICFSTQEAELVAFPPQWVSTGRRMLQILWVLHLCIREL